MLDDFMRELGDPASGRWRGIGAVSEYEWLADQIGKALTAGQWPPGSRVYLNDYGHQWYLLMASGQALGRAMQALAARGEVAIGEDGYYPRAPR